MAKVFPCNLQYAIAPGTALQAKIGRVKPGLSWFERCRYQVVKNSLYKTAKIIFPIIAMLLVATAMSACSSRQEAFEVVANPEVVTSLKRYSREFVLVPGDQLEIDVYRNPEISRLVVVRPDGNISLPLLDEVKAAGLTPLELDTAITEKLQTRLIDPEVTIIVNNPMDPMVYVFGEVGVVKPVPLRQARTLAQALAQAGGVTVNAALHDLVLVRLDDDGYIRLHQLANQTDGQAAAYVAFQNTPLRADDLIVVPESSRSIAGRFITDFLIEPLQALNLIITPYFQYQLIDILI